MAKKGMRVEVKRAKLANNKTSNLPITCKIKGCEDEAIVHSGTFHNRVKVCYYHFENPPMTATQKMLASYGLI